MGLEEIIDSIEKESANKREKILDDARKEAEKRKEMADAKADETIKKFKKRGEFDGNRIISINHSKNIIESRFDYQSRVEDAVKNGKDTLIQNIKRILESEIYPKLIEKILDKAVLELGDDCIIEARKEDIKRIPKGAGFNLKENKSLEGGIIAYSKDRKMYIDYSLLNIIRLYEEKIMKKFSDNIESESKGG